MPSYAEQRRLAYTPEQLFDLAADVERYPEFLPWWIAARIGNRGLEAYHTEQVIGFRWIRVRFASRTVLHRPERIDVTSEEGPFRRFEIHWSFQPAPEGGCHVGFRLDVEPRSKLVYNLLSLLLGDAARRVVTSFEKRARQLYGPPQTQPPATVPNAC